MCKLGDIIFVNEYIGDDGQTIGAHSFIVVDDTADTIQGLDYTHVATVISSFKSEAQRRKKLKYDGNVEVYEFEKKGEKTPFRKPSYVKADKLFYFNKNKLNYYVFGRISDELLDELFRVMLKLSEEGKLTIITDNLQEV